MHHDPRPHPVRPGAAPAELPARLTAHAATIARPRLADGAEALVFRPAAPARWCVVLAHGGGNDRLYGLWTAIEALLAQGVAVATAHLAGHGAGGRDHFTLPAARRRLDDLVQAAALASGAARVAVLGQSLGGALALDRLARGFGGQPVVAVSVPLGLDLGPAALGELLALARPEVRQALRGLPPRDVVPAVGPFNRARYPVRLPGGAPYLAAFGEALAALDLEARLAAPDRPPTPVLVVHGERDAIAPAAHGRRLLAAIGPAAGWLPVPGARHFDPLLDPLVVTSIARWLARHDQAAPRPDPERTVSCAISPGP